MANQLSSPSHPHSNDALRVRVLATSCGMPDLRMSRWIWSAFRGMLDEGREDDHMQSAGDFHRICGNAAMRR
jgi:hypothetical protein